MEGLLQLLMQGGGAGNSPLGIMNLLKALQPTGSQPTGSSGAPGATGASSGDAASSGGMFGNLAAGLGAGGGINLNGLDKYLQSALGSIPQGGLLSALFPNLMKGI